MLSEKQKLIDDAHKVFKDQKVLNLGQLMVLLKSSRRTAQTRLKQWGTYTSYNQNGRYYALPGVPKFNIHGIWNYKNILFSKHGNLKKSFISIVNKSQAGLSANEISEILRLPAHTFLGHFKETPDIHREKYKGLYIHFSKQSDIFAMQKKEREKIVYTTTLLSLPSDAQAVIILVELIKHTYDSIDKLVRQVKRKGVCTSVDKVQNLLIYHDLQKKALVLTD